MIDAELVPSLATLSLLDGLHAYLEEASFPGSVDLATDCSTLHDVFLSRFGGSPLLLEPVADEKDAPKTRVRTFL